MTFGLVLGLVPSAALAADPDPDAVAVGAGLASLAATLDGLAEIPVLAADLPLTATSPAELLGLDAGVLSSTLGAAVGVGTHGSFADLESAIEGADLTDAATGLEITYSEVATTEEGDGTTTIALTLDVARTVDVPVGHRDGDDVLLAAGDLPTTATLTTDLVLSYDPDDEIDGGSRALILINDPEVAVSITADSALSAAARYGFTDVTVAGTAAIDLALKAPLVDPDGQGGITHDEWETTLPADLVAPEATGGYELELALDTDLVTGSPDGTVAVDLDAGDLDGGDLTADAPEGVWPAATVDIGNDLAALGTMNADDALVGLGQLAGLLTASQARADAGIPFSDLSVADLFDPGADLGDLVSRQGDALVVCGRADTSPPSGGRQDGDPIACQAFTDTPADGTVTWNIDGTEVTDASGGTVGPTPDANATLSTASADPDVTVTFTPTGGDEITAEQRFRSMQELETDLESAGVTVDVTYDDGTRTLQVSLSRTETSLSADADPVAGDVLREASRLADLDPTSDPFQVTGTDAAFSVDIGFVLGAEDPDAAVPALGEDDDRLRGSTRTFLRDAAGDEITLASLSATGVSAAWDARIGYLPVTVTTSDLAISGGATDDALAVNIPAVGDVDLPADDRSTTTVSQAVLLRDLINDLSGVTATSDLDATATLAVADAAALTASGTVTVTGWGSSPTATLGADYLEDLHVFDIAPTVTGTATSGTTTSLTDGGAGFLTAFGKRLSAGDAVAATLFNVTQGATCAGFTVTSDTELTCDDALVGPPDAEVDGDDTYTWAAGDHYEVRGDEAALAPVILESLYDLLNRLDLADLGDDDPWTSDLPLVDAAPDELVTVLADAATDIATLREALAVQDQEPAEGETPVEVPQDLAELEAELTDRLGVPVEFGLADIDREVAGSVATTHLTVGFTLADGGSLDLPLQIDLGDHGLRQDEAAEDVTLEHTSTATIDLAVPLSLDVDPADAYVGDTTEVTLDATVDTGDDLSVQGRVGPIDVGVRARPDIVGAHQVATVTGTDDRSLDTSGEGEDPPRDDPPSATVLKDSTAAFTDDDPETDDEVEVGLLVEKLDGPDGSPIASCVITSLTATTITCDDGLDADEEWDNGDNYRIAIPSATVLRDPDADDLEEVVAGQLLEKLDPDGTTLATCVVTAADVEAGTITCDDGLVDDQDDADVWEDGDDYGIAGADGVQLDVTATLNGPAGPTDDHLAGLAGTLAGGDVCGDSSDDACSELELRLIDEAGEPGDVLGIVSHVDDVDDDDPATIVVPDAVTDAIGAATLDWDGLDDATAFVPGILTDALDGRLEGTRLPLVGADLDGGDVPDEVRTLLEGFDLGTAVDEAVVGLAEDGRLDTAIETAVSDELGDAAGEDDVVVECTDTCDEPFQVDSVTVHLQASDTDVVATVPFETGLPGLNLTIDDGEVDTTVDWDLDITFGIERTGPFLEAGTEDLLSLDLSADIADDASLCHTLPEGLPTDETFSGARCLEGTVGLVPATLYDSSTAASALDATLGVGLEDDLTFEELLDHPTGTLTIADTTTGSVNLLFIGDDAGVSIKLPTIAGVLTYDYDHDGTAGYTDGYSDPSYADVGLDIGAFLPDFVAPIVDQFTNYVGPLEPVIDTLLEPIPVVSDLSKATGGGPISLLTLMQAVSGNELGLVERVGALLKLADELEALENTGYIELTNKTGGSGASGNMTTAFTVPVREVQKGTCGTTPGERDCRKSTTSVGSAGATYSRSVVNEVGKNNTPVTRTASGTATASGAGVTFPFLNDSSEIYGMILGFDATLVRFDAGTLAATAGLSVGFGPFMAGPVPVEVTIGGAITLQGRFAMGFDTRGLRAAAAGGRGSDLILDGIFIDDFDDSGNDVPEAQLIATITAGASVSVKIFKVGIEGGVTLKFLLDLEDSRAGADGKLRIDTIREYSGEPLCLFEFSSTLEFFLNMFVQIDFKIFTKKLTYELWRLKPPIELFSVSCELPPPVWASPSGSDLRLNIGAYASDRGRYTTEANEIFQVHQLTAEGAADGGGTDVEVVFQGIALRYTVPAGGKITGDAGGGNDVIQLLPGVDDDDEAVPFTLDSDLDGGAGNDQLDGGGGDDELSGGEGRDTLRGGAGDDRLDGGGGADGLEGGLGDDHLDGGSGDDRLTGAAGADVLLGGSGDDQLEAGPGLRPGIQNDTSLEDGRNVLIGGTGADRLQGGHLDDALFGDGAPTTTTGTVDAVIGLVDALSDADIATACATAGDDDAADELSGDGGDDLLVGGGGNDRIDGDDGDDTLCGGTGDDRIDGGDGGDDLMGGAGHDRLFGGSGTDVIDGGAGDDLLDGGEGSDTLTGAAGADAVLGGAGGDTIYGDLADGSEGDTGAATTCATRAHVLAGGLLDLDGDGTADDGRFAGYTVIGGAVDVNGDGTIEATDNAVIVDGELVVDAGKVDARGAATVDGTAVIATGNGDCILGGAGGDTVHAGGGDDQVYGEAGDDTINGDAGDDLLRGAAGEDTINGGAGDDTLYGDAGDDELNGDAGDDLLRGGLDDDDINGGTGQDAAYGGAGSDVIHGDADDDTLYGDADDDELYGDGGTDTIFGGEGDDYAEGNAGPDDIHGQAGEDVLIGGTSQAGANDAGDTISGGDGDDLMAGDNASHEPPSALPSVFASLLGIGTTGTLELHDVQLTTQDAVDGSLFGADIIDGDAGEDRAYGQGGDDLLRGGGDDDHLEGGHGDDDLYGDDGDDDLIGGSSADEAGLPDRASYPSTLTDGDDVLLGGAGDDLLLGDNATAIRDGDLEAGGTAPPVRDVLSALEEADPDGAFGDDRLYGEAGRDQLFGQLGDDLLIGAEGDDVLVGDLGTATPTVREAEVTHTTRAPFITVVFDEGTVRWDVELYGFDVADGALGHDALLGGDGRDSLHAGPGDDVLDGGADSDDVFGGDGDDVAWGGPGIDRLWGGRGEDHLDVPDRELDGKPGAVDLTGYGRAARGSDNETPGTDDQLPTLDGRDEGAEGYLGADLIYGGLDQDVLLADVGDAGRTPGDRLVDAVGNHNAFLRCPNAYGEGIVTRQIGPPLRSFLQDVAADGGAVGSGTPGTSGFNEIAIVFPSDAQSNNQPHPSVPSSGVCPAG